MEQFKYFETTPTDQNSIHEEIKSSLKSRNACYHSVQNFCLQFAIQKCGEDYMARSFMLCTLQYILFG
jgi:hypothetical protein